MARRVRVVIATLARVFVRFAIEHQTKNFRRAQQGKRFLQKAARSFIGRDDDDISIDPPGEQTAVGSGKYGRRVENDIVEPLPCFSNQIAEAAGRENLVGISLRPARSHNGDIERLERPGDLLETKAVIE